MTWFIKKKPKVVYWMLFGKEMCSNWCEIDTVTYPVCSGVGGRCRRGGV